jgi:oxygen-independent coproporphyrinogen-3 oxidase
MAAVVQETPLWLVPRAAYVHVPFCAHHCGYCDFAVVAGQDHLIDRYLSALEKELATLGRPQPMRTLFIGGGTPSHLSPRQLEQLLALVTHWLPPDGPDVEFTVEANPDRLDEDRVRVLAEHGVNRVSLGVQSFQPELLRVLERPHRPEDVPRAVARVKHRIAAVSLDLIFGVPGQTLDQWHADLEHALALGPDHVSTYGLTYEKGTRLWKQRQRGEVRPLDEEAELELYEHAIEVLEGSGFEHYEISNFARPGRRSRHNQVYWANHAYHGFGVGAARYAGGQRQLNTRNLADYLRRLEAGQPAMVHAEQLPPAERARETLALNLRRRDGVHRGEFLEQTGFDLDALAGQALQRQVELGLLEDDGQRVRLTRRGQVVADAIIATLFRPPA